MTRVKDHGTRTHAFYPRYVLGVMAAAYFLCFVDRQIIGILLPQIGSEFGLSDTELGLLVGPAFGIIYAALSVPLASLGDRFNRRNVVAASIGLFSLMTFLSGFAAQFWHLLIVRFGFGAGQAGIQPSINSLLSDLIPKKNRSAALATAVTGGKVGQVAAVLIGGLVAATYGWRTAMIVAGVPGLIFTVVVLFTIREPKRGAVDNRTDRGRAPGIGQAIRILLNCPSYRDLLLSAIFVLITASTLSLFVPTMLVRTHGFSIEETTWAMTGYGVLAAIATYVVGLLVDRLAQKDIRWILYVPALLQVIVLPFYPLFVLSDNQVIAIAAGAIPLMLGGGAFAGPVYAAVQNVSPLRVRSIALGIYLFLSGIIGSAIGPQMLGFLSDELRVWAGQDSLGVALLLLAPPTLLIGGYFFWRAARTFEADIARAESDG